MIIYSRKECNQLARNIETAIKNRFDWVVKVTIEQTGKWHWRLYCGKDRYDLYPWLSKDDADKAIMQDIMDIIHSYMPSASLTDYNQSGKTHYPSQVEHE